MKRPFGIYFVALWLFFCGTMILSLVFRILSPQLMADNGIVQILKIVSLAFLIYIGVGLIQLKLHQRIIAMAIFSLISIYQVSLLLAFFLSPTISIEIIKLILLKILVVLVSVICIIYLLDSQFREYAKKYLDWKKQDSMQKYLQKRMTKGISK